MADWFLGQYLSNRTGNEPRDSTRDKIWAALRYLIMVGFLVVIVVFVDQEPVGAFATALGGALLASAIVNVALVPAPERKDTLNAIWAVLGIALLAYGIPQLG
jgi:drug/metabolite transporter superfamily protein YnfA